MARQLPQPPAAQAEGPTPPERKRFRTKTGPRRAPKVRGEDARPFVLIYRPGRYEVFGDRVLPNLVQQPLQSGLGGVRELGDGSWDLRGLRDDVEQTGGIILDPETVDYVFPTEDGGVETVWKDAKGYHELIASWVDAGELPGPEIEDVRKIVEDKRHVLGLIMTKHPGNVDAHETYGASELRRQITVAERTLAAMEGA